MFLVIKLFRIVAFYQFLKNGWILINHGLFLQKKILNNSTDSNFKNILKISKYLIFKYLLLFIFK